VNFVRVSSVEFTQLSGLCPILLLYKSPAPGWKSGETGCTSILKERSSCEKQSVTTSSDYTLPFRSESSKKLAALLSKSTAKYHLQTAITPFVERT